MKVITVGRSDEHNDIVVNDNKVSRNHLQMVMDDQGNFSVMDLNSTNGTFVNGQRITGEVPLRVTDELRIGDTVLPWQSYFSNRPKMEIGNPVPPRTSTPHTPVSHRQHNTYIDPPKHWMKYVIIGIVVLLLIGGGIVWIISKDKPGDKTPDVEQTWGGTDVSDNGQNELIEAERIAAEKKAKYEETLREVAEKQAEQERLEKIAAQSNSEKDKNAAEKAKKDLESYKQKAQKEGQDLVNATNEVSKLKEQINGLKKDLQQVNDDKNKLNDDNNKLKDANATINKSLELNNKMQKILNQWNDNQAHDFCEKELKLKIDKDQARNNVAKWFSEPNNNVEKEKKVKKMDEWSRKNKIKNYKSIQ